MTQYSNIAQIYADSQDRRLLRWGVTDPYLYQRIGDITGLDVLDLACGDGRLSRQFKLRGARRVVGVDAEPKMIELARAREAKEKLGIEYLVGKIGSFPKVGEFDLAVPGFLLHYAESRGQLMNMCFDIYRDLKVGGRMVGINQNPDNPKNPFKKYGSTVEPLREPVMEGDLIKIRLYDNDKETISFTNIHWNKSTYEYALNLAGFKDIHWIPMQASEEAIAKMGKDFWSDWLSQPSLVILEATK